MRTLYHLWMSPFCRKARIFLGEKRLEHELRIENIWERREEFLALNPAGTLPVLVEIDGTAISGADVICEFLDEVHEDPPLIGRTPVIRAEVRRRSSWAPRCVCAARSSGSGGSSSGAASLPNAQPRRAERAGRRGEKWGRRRLATMCCSYNIA